MTAWWRLSSRYILSEDRLAPILIAAILAVLTILFLWALSSWYGGQPGEILRGMYIEATGAAMDIVVFGIILALMGYWTNRRCERASDIARQRELIDDFKKWNTDEARYRIAGALRRLGRLNSTKVDFSGLELSDFSFTWHEIDSIEGSTFYDGSWGTLSRRDRVILERTDFTELNCRNVVFSRSNPFSSLKLGLHFATFRDCRFENAQLHGAVFRGAQLEWSTEPPVETGEWVELEDGSSAYCQNYWPPFDGANLKDASFQDVYFQNADFRGALNIHDCSFSGAKGLNECMFDDDEVRKRVQEAAESTGR